MAGSAHSGDFDNGELFSDVLQDGGFSGTDVILAPTHTMSPALASVPEEVDHSEGGFAGQRLIRVGAPGEGNPDLGGSMNQGVSVTQAEFGPTRVRSLDDIQGTFSFLFFLLFFSTYRGLVPRFK